MVAPFGLIGILAILYIRFGWPGILILAVIIIIMPIQACVGKANGIILQRVNINKDLRVKTCTEIIEGIKFIKLYGWEIAFKHIIQQLRRDEIKDYVKLSFTRSLERSLGNSTTFIAGLTCFLVMHFTGAGTGLSVAKIFSTMELMVTTRLIVFFLGITWTFYYELKVIFDRLCTIYNIEDSKMI